MFVCRKKLQLMTHNKFRQKERWLMIIQESKDLLQSRKEEVISSGPNCWVSRSLSFTSAPALT